MALSICELRTSSKDKRELFIKDSFHVSEIIFKNIRNSDTRKNLINAAQFLKRNNFPMTHNNVTWLAGFTNNTLIAKNFGSIYALRHALNALPETNTWNGKVQFSKQDILKNINIPKKITPEVAEIAGIHAGDGTQWLHSGSYSVRVAGSKEEREYYDNHISPLYFSAFGIKLIPQCFGRKNLYGIEFSSKAVVTFQKNILNFPLGKKSKTVTIPNALVRNKDLLRFFIKGLADTDFCLSFRKQKKDRNFYPEIEATFASRRLVMQLKEILEKKFGFRTCTVFDIESKSYGKKQSTIKILGFKQLEKWMKEIGFSNPIHITKYNIWKRFGFCPVRTTLSERYKVLEGKLDPNLFYR